MLSVRCSSLQARLCELEEVCEGRAQELAALEELSHCASDRLETSGSEINHLQAELTKTRLQVRPFLFIHPDLHAHTLLPHTHITRPPFSPIHTHTR